MPAKSNEAVRRISGREVPTGVQIRFIENEGVHLTHVLPDYTGSGDELTENELLQVSAAGDKDGGPTCPNCGSKKTYSNPQNGYVYCENCKDVFE